MLSRRLELLQSKRPLLVLFYTHEQCAFLESEEPDDIRFMKKNLGLEIRDIDSLSLEDELAQPFIERL